MTPASLTRAEAILHDRIFDPPLEDLSDAAEICRVNIQAFALQGLGWRDWECKNKRSRDRGKRVTRYCGDTCYAYCGAFVAFCLLEDGLGPAARRALASTYKLWHRYPPGHVARIRPEEIQPRDVVVVRHQDPARRLRWGDHITLARGHADPVIFPSIEGNAHGRWPDGRWIEGVVANRRQLSEVVVAYRIPAEEYVTA